MQNIYRVISVFMDPILLKNTQHVPHANANPPTVFLVTSKLKIATIMMIVS